ncbi:hypothetical protein Sm713_50080 [Streptomyces sp. TS71-3]|nr:hypothetical protein Sm713_50080 [Streptomyces sp. TS71-3]
MRKPPGQERGGARSGQVRLAVHLEAQLAFQHQERLLVGVMPVHGAAEAALGPVLQDGAVPAARVPPIRIRTSAPRNRTAPWTPGGRSAGTRGTLSPFRKVTFR